MREQILRLEEQQHDEEEAAAMAAQLERDEHRLRAEAARLAAEGPKASREVLRGPKMVAFEEELEDDDDAARQRVAMRGVRGDSEGSDDGEEVVVCYRYFLSDNGCVG